jgi:hypothetical protein
MRDYMLCGGIEKRLLVTVCSFENQKSVTLNMIQMHRDGWIMDGSAAAQ